MESITLEARTYARTLQDYFDGNCTKAIYLYPPIESWSYELSKSSEVGIELKLFDLVNTTNNIPYLQVGGTASMSINFSADGSATFTLMTYSYVVNNRVIAVKPDFIKENFPPFTLKKQ